MLPVAALFRLLRGLARTRHVKLSAQDVEHGRIAAEHLFLLDLLLKPGGFRAEVSLEDRAALS